jgi:hypothetical protein
VIAPPSATVGEAVNDTVVVSIVSLTLVVADVESTFSTSKPPPDALLIVLDTEPASSTTSSPGAATEPSRWSRRR